MGAMRTIAQQPVTVTSPYGTFTFQTTVETERYLGHKLKGTIVNETTKDWLNLEFDVTYYDLSGQQLDTIVGNKILVPELKRGTSYSLGSGYGETILTTDSKARGKPIARYQVILKQGTLAATYMFALVQNKSGPEAKQTNSIQSGDLQFSDDSCRFTFSISKLQFAFVLYNRTDDPIEIDWNKVAFVDTGGESHKVIHSGVKYVNRNEPLAPTTVPPSAKLEDIVFPADYVYFIEGEYGGWREAPLFPDGDKAPAFKGQTFRLFMPAKVKGGVKNYSFIFRIADVTL